MSDDRVELKARRKEADEILARHIEYMGWPESGQNMMKTSGAIAAVEEALASKDAAIESLQAEVERYRQALVRISSDKRTHNNNPNDYRNIARQALAAKEQTR